jgi:hypothetical protein
MAQCAALIAPYWLTLSETSATRGTGPRLPRGRRKIICGNPKIPIDAIPTMRYIWLVLSDEGALLEAILQRQSESWPDRGAPEWSTAWWPGGAPGGAAPALGARGALPREVGTLIPPPRVPAGALAPPAAPSPRLGSRGTGKPRTLCAARTRNHVRHSGALAPLRKRTRNPDVKLGGSTPLDSGFAPRGAPRNDDMKWLFEF